MDIGGFFENVGIVLKRFGVFYSGSFRFFAEEIGDCCHSRYMLLKTVVVVVVYSPRQSRWPVLHRNWSMLMLSRLEISGVKQSNLPKQTPLNGRK